MASSMSANHFSVASYESTWSIVRWCAGVCERVLPRNDLTVESLLRDAERCTGLTSWGEFPFREGLEAVVRSIEADLQPRYLARAVIWRLLRRLLVNRLCTQAALAAQPEIAARKITRPLVVLGFPRTGTTLLHHLLALDPQSRPLLGWEALYPAPLYAKGKPAQDRRRQNCERMHRLFYRLFPKVAAAHNFTPDGPEECAWMLMTSFIPTVLLNFALPSYRDWMATVSDDYLVGAYGLHQRQLQILQGPSAEHRWTLKAPTHFYGLHGLTTVYPDAVLVQTHRDLAAVVGSSSSMVSKTLPNGSKLREGIGIDILKSLKVVQDRGMAVRDRLPSDRVIDIRYDDLVARPVEVVEEIYRAAALPLPADMGQRVRQWLAENPQHKHGKHDYRLEEFGVNRAMVEETLGPRELPFLTP